MAKAKDETTDGKEMQQARSAALSRLREENRARYNEILVEEAAKRGITWTPQPTKEEKAEAELQRLLAENPALAEKYAPVS
jgi:uncharacterized protein YdeI (YjbR/CyaY-like superfamily)